MTNINSKPDFSSEKEKRNLAALKVQKAKEKIFKLIVKIISWESGSLGSPVVQSINKISSGEWILYKKHRLSVFAAIDKEKAKKELAETFNSIKTHGGFE